MVSKEELIEQINNFMKDRNQNTDKVNKAYQIADKLHGNQKRKDGTSYICHPLEVALILAENGFDEDVVCAAILHDTIEDCKYTREDMINDFGDYVAAIVESVTEIKPENFHPDEEVLRESEEYMHSIIDEATYNKFIREGKTVPAGFYVKFADRIHNLRTIGIFSVDKQSEKVKETERYILPISKIMKSNTFTRLLENECFKINERDTFEDLEYLYKDSVKMCDSLANKVYNQFKNFFMDKTPKTNIYKSLVTEYEIYTKLIEKGYIKPNSLLNNVSDFQLNKFALYNIFVVSSYIDKDNDLFYFLFGNNSMRELNIVGAGTDSITNEPYIVVSDSLKVLYNIYHMSAEDYKKYNLGDKIEINYIDSEYTNEIATDYINVRTKSEEIRQIPENSTVLDFAFSLHEDIGLSFKNAHVMPAGKIYTDDDMLKLKKHGPDFKLKKDDKVIIYCNEEEVIDENGNKTTKKIPCAKIKWLAKVNNESSKNKLINYFEKKYEKTENFHKFEKNE